MSIVSKDVDLMEETGEEYDKRINQFKHFPYSEELGKQLLKTLNGTKAELPIIHESNGLSYFVIESDYDY